MKIQKAWEKYSNCIIAVLTILVNIILLSLFFDFYYDMNDDVMMKDIMSGAYSGTPDAHNMQTLYILGIFISLLYRLCGNISWYGLFLFICQMGSIYLVGLRLFKLCRKKWAKAGCVALITAFIWGISLTHIISIQYTLTCSMMAAAAIFLFMTTESGLPTKEFIIKNIPSITLVILAYQLRTEMLLLLFPFICLAGLFRWAGEKKFFQEDNFLKYGTIIGVILCGMLISRLIDVAAYGSEDWKAFVSFFNSRTEVYDFHYDILRSGEHSEYLESIGLNDSQQELLANYNFGLSEDIDDEVMGRIADYAVEADTNENLESQGTLRVWIGGIFWQTRICIYRLFHAEDAPYNILVICGYICVFILGILDMRRENTSGRRLSFLWELALLVIFRMVLWLYILLQGRYPERITHSLYLAEFMVLMGLLCMRLKNIRLSGTGLTCKNKELPEILLLSAAPVLIALICIIFIPKSLSIVKLDIKNREEINRGGQAVAAYCRAHPENYYFEDVYSTVYFSQKIFKNVDNSFTNYDVMGGWFCKSPLYKEKLKKVGITTMEDGLLYNPFVYLIVDTREPTGNTDWLEQYYEQKGVMVRIEQVDLIDEGFTVYQVVEE
ncbi:MAG: hypothetical protein NC433_10030 [Clostridiales bacterium]|nr:hypothetical protein [Clostridiales bacterium]